MPQSSIHTSANNQLKNWLQLNTHLIKVFFVWKAVTVLLLITSYYLTPLGNNSWNFHYYTEYRTDEKKRSNQDEIKRIEAPFTHWDGQHYLGLAKFGYRDFREESAAFYPLLPLTIRVLKPLVGNHFLAGFFLVSVTSFFFFYFFVHLVKTIVSSNKSYRSLILLLCFPTSFFLTTIYTEALFLSLLFGFLYFFEARHSYASLPFALLLPLCRPQGLLIPIALIAGMIWQKSRNAEILPPKFLIVTNLTAFAVGCGLLFQFYNLTLDNPWIAFKAQEVFVFENATTNLFNPVHFVSFMLSRSAEWFAYTGAITDKIWITIMLLGCILVAKLSKPIWFFLYMTLTFVPAIMGKGGSYARFALLAFPFLSIAIIKNVKISRTGLVWVCTLLVLIQTVYLIRFAANLWVG